MDNNIDINKNNKIELALASLMFFAPLIKYNLKSRKDINESDKNFIWWFIKLWYLNIWLLWLSIILWIVSYITNIQILNTCSTIIVSILAVLLLIWSIFAIMEKSIMKAEDIDNHIEKQVWSTDAFQIILSYIPLYNIYLWYEKHDFDWNNLYLKESLILRWIFSIMLLMVSNRYILIWFWILIFLMMLLSLFQVKFWLSYEQFIKNLFKKNPEEIWGSMVWVLMAPFGWQTVKETIDMQKWKYSLIFKLEHKQVLLELILIVILSGFGIYMWVVATNYTLIVWIILILARYLVMLVKWKHMPHIPVIKEITNIFFISKKA